MLFSLRSYHSLRSLAVAKVSKISFLNFAPRAIRITFIPICKITFFSITLKGFHKINGISQKAMVQRMSTFVIKTEIKNKIIIIYSKEASGYE